MTSEIAYCTYKKITLKDLKNCLNELDGVRAEIYKMGTEEVYVESIVDGNFEFLNRFFVDVISLSGEERFPKHDGSVFYFEHNSHPKLRDVLAHILTTYGGFILDDVSPNWDEKTKGKIFYYWKNNIHLFRL